MPSLFAIAGFLTAAYLSTFAYNLIRNYVYARRSGLPYLIVPWDQNHFIWMIISVPLRKSLKESLPTWIFDRIDLTIYGFEFHRKLEHFDRFATPQGNPYSYVMVTPGKFEISTRDPEMATEILRRPADFMQMEFTKLFIGRFGPNVLSTDGDVWARHRRVVASTINEKISKTVFKESIEQTKGLLDEVIGDDESGETSKLFDMMKKITINVLSGAGMGTSVPWSDEENENQKPQKGFRMTYIEAVKTVVECVAGPIILPKWFLDNYPGFLPGHRLLKSLGHAIEEFPAHTQELLEKEKQRSAEIGAESRSNIMSQLLLASESEKEGRALSDDELMGNLFVFTAAGFDTTANTLSYALVLMARYPEWQTWVSSQIDKIMPESPTADLDYASIIPKATRVLAIMFETIRLYPPVIHLAKSTHTAQTITTSRGSYWIPPGATMYVDVVGVHIDPAVYRNLNLNDICPDADDQDELHFRPTRWIVKDEKGNESLWSAPKGSFVPWSAGPRVCPGQKMAQVEFTSIFLQLFRRHKIEAVSLDLGGGKMETRQEMEKRLDERMTDSISIMTLQMNDVYNDAGDGKGLKLRLRKRK